MTVMLYPHFRSTARSNAFHKRIVLWTLRVADFALFVLSYIPNPNATRKTPSLLDTFSLGH